MRTVSALSLALVGATSYGDNLLKNASFEAPKVTGVTDARKGGTPVLAESENSWFKFQSLDRTDKVTVGITDQLGRTGKQSLFVRFNKAASTRGAMLLTELIPVKAGAEYRISLWGRLDTKEPLTLDQGRPYMMVDVEFYPLDQASRIGETETRTQMIPGSPQRRLFVPGKWTEYYATFKAPVGTEFLRLGFRWESPRKDGEATGVIYFDDAVIDGPAGTAIAVDDPPEPADTEEAPAPAAPPVTQ